MLAASLDLLHLLKVTFRLQELLLNLDDEQPCPSDCLLNG
jgi:hypothetical protein